MIDLKKLNGETIYVNPRHIYKIEAVPDTVLMFVNGEKLPVGDKIDAVIQKIRRWFTSPHLLRTEFTED
jgi:flagellar protein FlbD